VVREAERERVGDVVVSPGTMTPHLVVIISAVFGLLDGSRKVGVVISCQPKKVLDVSLDIIIFNCVRWS
jgi:hypothetical protein